jgi:hypothetical protein
VSFSRQDALRPITKRSDSGEFRLAISATALAASHPGYHISCRATKPLLQQRCRSVIIRRLRVLSSRGFASPRGCEFIAFPSGDEADRARLASFRLVANWRINEYDGRAAATFIKLRLQCHQERGTPFIMERAMMAAGPGAERTLVDGAVNDQQRLCVRVVVTTVARGRAGTPQGAQDSAAPLQSEPPPVAAPAAVCVCRAPGFPAASSRICDRQHRSGGRD